MASSSSPLHPSTSGTGSSDVDKDLSYYLPLYKAAIRGDWESASRFFDSNPDAFSCRITKNLETVLHIAVGRSEAIGFIEKLMELMPTEALYLKSKYDDTALHYAAKYGNTRAAKLLVARGPGLPHIWNNSNMLPLHLAALLGHKEMVQYMLTVTNDNESPNAFADQPGITLLMLIVNAGFYDVALDLVRRYPKLATTLSQGGNTALSILAGKPSAFPSGASLRSWQKLLYSCIPVKLAMSPHRGTGFDVESSSEQSRRQINICWRTLIRTVRRNYFRFVCQKFYTKFWDVMKGAVPLVKNIHDTKLMHCQAMELVKCLCVENINVDTSKSTRVFKPAVILAATGGVYEVIEEVLSSFPGAIWCLDQEQHDLFQLAVINRRENIFNLLYGLDEHAHLVTQNIDKHNNNILHLAGKLAQPHRLNLVAGSALQMQRELQWYKEVEKFVTPSYKAKESSEGKTPPSVFAEEHQELIAEGEQWLKDTSKSCMFAATLIATVVFAAAVTVPGGSNTKSGLPIFQKQTPFLVFAVSNAISLFSSVTCVLMFLSVLTSRSSAADFLFSLPNKLIVGLVNLFLSLAFMMIAFSSAVYAVFGEEKAWILAPIGFLACFPVTLFFHLQYPLLKDMIRSTYGPSIFGKKLKSTVSKSGT